MYVFVIGKQQLLARSRVLVGELSKSVIGDEFANKLDIFEDHNAFLLIW
jgi:hypothetical protein